MRITGCSVKCFLDVYFSRKYYRCDIFELKRNCYKLVNIGSSWQFFCSRLIFGSFFSNACSDDLFCFIILSFFI